MGLSELPPEILWIIAFPYLHQRDTYALIRTNRHLYHALRKCLYLWNARYNHGSAISAASEHNIISHIRRILQGLQAAHNEDHSPPREATRGPRSQVDRYYDSEEDSEEEEEEEEEPCEEYPYWRDIYAHPLLSKGYSVLAIINIQHALVVAAQAGHIKVIEILLDFGAQYGHVEVVGNLLARGADPQLYTPLPLYRAVEDGRRDIISLLLKLDVRSQKAALKLAVLQEDCSMVQFLLCGVEAPENGNAGLFVAEMKGFKDIVSLLKTHGVSIDALDECDKDDWEKEDGDGAVRFHYYMKPQQCMGDQAGIDEDSDESELDN
ncbi:unnamed protein product [Penicillium manginii]